MFEALTDSNKFSELTGAPAEIDNRPGGKISCFGGMILGQTIESEPNQLIVQVWRPGNWDKGVHSIIKINLESVSDSETKLMFTHSGFPEEHKTHLESGWNERYWGPLKKYLEK